MPQTSRDSYSEKLIEYDDEAAEVEEVLGDISSGSALANDELTAARLDNLKARTALIEQKLAEQKQTIWNQWNEEFFDAFTEAFGKFKNELISLHLSEEQLNVLTTKLENALTIMQDKLDSMWSRFKNESEETNNE